MRLPVCSSSTTRKGVKVGTLLQELGGRGFSGYCTILVEGMMHALVMENGRVRAAESQEKRGDSALQFIRSLSEKDAEAVICDLSPPVLRAVIGENSACAVAGMRPQDEAVHAATTKVKPVSIKPGEAKKIQIRSVTVRKEGIPEEEPEMAAQNVKVETGPSTVKSINRATLESIKGLGEAFRSDAVDLLREFNMEHLIVKKQERKERFHNS